ncbi:MAG: hypothetical protein ABI920_04935 [Casimicrobiaceae bacterium]
MTTTSPVSREMQRCRTVDNVSQVVRGYNVVYHTTGRDVALRLPYDPGRRVQVAVGIKQ